MLRILTLVTLFSGIGMAAGEQEGGSPDHLLTDYLSQRPKTILELQPFRKETTITLQTAKGQWARATLVNLNPYVSVWYLLQIEVNGEKTKRQYHIENPFAHQQQIRLEDDTDRQLVIDQKDKITSCEIWSSDTSSALDKAQRHLDDLLQGVIKGNKIGAFANHRSNIRMLLDKALA